MQITVQYLAKWPGQLLCARIRSQREDHRVLRRTANVTPYCSACARAVSSAPGHSGRTGSRPRHGRSAGSRTRASEGCSQRVPNHQISVAITDDPTAAPAPRTAANNAARPRRRIVRLFIRSFRFIPTPPWRSLPGSACWALTRGSSPHKAGVRKGGRSGQTASRLAGQRGVRRSRCGHDGQPPGARMPDPAQELNEQLRALETRAQRARKAAGLPCSRREAARETVRTPYAVAVRFQAISSWLAAPPARATIPSPGSSEHLLALVRVWSDWAGEKTNERSWRNLLEKAQPSPATSSQLLASPADRPPTADGHEATTGTEREKTLGLAARRSLARRLTRLSSTPSDRRDDVLEWLHTQAQAFVEVPFGSVRVLVAPMGAGKSEEA